MTSSAGSPPIPVDNINSASRERNNYCHSTPFRDSERDKHCQTAHLRDNQYLNMERDTHGQDANLRDSEKESQFQDSERDSPMDPEKGAEGDGTEPAHHARRPMNSFLIFCKHHRAVVRAKFPKLENRAITKILGEWWAILDKSEKAPFTKLAKEFKDAFFAAHPHFQWYKLPAPPLRNAAARPNSVSLSDQEPCPPPMDMADFKAQQTNNNDIIKINYNQPSTSKQTSQDKPTFTPGKLADEAQMGGLSSLILPASDTELCHEFKINITPPGTPNHKINVNYTPKPPKKRHYGRTDDDYYVNDVSPPSEDQNKEKKLQDALSETMRSFRESDSEFNDSFTQMIKLPNQNEDSVDDKRDVFPVDSNVTNQKLIDEVVNKEFTFSDSWNESQESQDSQMEGNNNAFSGDYSQLQGRASGRAKKGKLYQAFMADGGLMGNKRHKKDFDPKISPKIDMPSKYSWNCSKKGAMKSELIMYNNTKVSETSPDATLMSLPEVSSEVDDMGQQTFFYDENASEHSEEIMDNAGSKAFDFDLEDRIAGLPTLSFEEYSMKKKENKKRKKFSKQSTAKKICTTLNNPYEYSVTHGGSDLFNLSEDCNLRETNAQSKSAVDYKPHTKLINMNQNMSHHERMYLAEERKSAIIGSKKRKPRKNSINRIEISSSTNLQHTLKLEVAKSINKVLPTSAPMMNQTSVLCGLDTLAEVAANTCKMEEET